MLDAMLCVLLCLLEVLGGDVLYAALLAGRVGGVGGDTLCATLIAGCVDGAGCAGSTVGDTLCTALFAGGVGGDALWRRCMLEVLEAPEMRCVLSVCWRLWRVDSVC